MEISPPCKADPSKQVLLTLPEMSSLSHPNPPEKPPQLDDFCRICLLRKAQLRPLATQFSGVMIPEMLYKVTGTLINMQEQLPRVICDRCLVKLDLAYSISEEFRKQEEKLRRFWWKGGVLVDELVQYQRTEESWRKTHSEEVMDRLASGRLDPVPVVVGAVNATAGASGSGVTEKSLVKSEPADASTVCIEILSDDSADEAVQEPTPQHVIINQIEMMVMPAQKSCDLQAESNELLVKRRESPVQQQQQPEEEDTFDADAPPSPAESGSERNDNDKDSDYVPDDIEDQDIGLLPAPVESGTEESISEDDDIESGSSSDAGIPGIEKGDTVCPVCNQKYRNFESLKRHHRRHILIAKQRYKCKKCGWVVASKAELRTHKLTHLNAQKRNRFQCEYCQLIFTHQPQFLAHHKMHEMRNDPLPDPDQNESSSSGIQQDKRKGRLFGCKICGKAFNWKCRLRKHELTHENKRITTMRAFSSKLQRRKWSNRQWECELCPRTFERQIDLNQHLEKHEERSSSPENDEFRYKCMQCGKTFQFKNRLELHLKRHVAVEEGTYRCPKCEKLLATNYELRRHMLSHESKTEWLKTCEKMLPPLSIVRDGKTYYKCRDCAKVFVSRSNYFQHARMHDVAKPEAFQCPDCGKRFGQRANLRLHQHEAHKLFIKAEPEERQEATAVLHCNECDTLFSSPESYEIHLQGHRGEAAAVASEEDPSQEATNQVSDQPSALPIIQNVTGSFVKNEAPIEPSPVVQELVSVDNPQQEQVTVATEEATDAMDIDQADPAPEWQDHASASGSDYASHPVPDERPDRSQATPSIGSELEEATGYSIEILSDDSDDDGDDEDDAVIALSEDEREPVSRQASTSDSGKSQTWACTLCDFVITTESNAPINKHMHMHQNIMNGKYKCEVCQKKFGFNPELQKHRRLIHNLKQPEPDDTVECDKCYKKIKRNKFSFHLACHKNLEERNIVCKVCDKAFGSKHQLNYHRSSKSCRQAHQQQQRPPSATAVPVLIQRGNTLQTPEQRQPEGRYKCRECNKSFANSQAIYVHMQQHQALKEGRFTCEICKMAFPSQRDLEAHVRTHPESAQQGADVPTT